MINDECSVYQSIDTISSTIFSVIFNLYCSHFPTRYIEIFRSTEQQMMKSLMQTTPQTSFGGRSSNNGNFSSNGNNRMHPYERNGGNNFGRGNNNMRGRNQNMRNDFRRGKLL